MADHRHTSAGPVAEHTSRQLISPRSKQPRVGSAKTIMSSFATQAAETFQTAHLRQNPDPRHDINPSKRSPASLGVDSDSEDDDDTTYALQKPQSKPFPPIPDLRFEQSYLHSISKAETWWEVLFITVKDQVRSFPACHSRPMSRPRRTSSFFFFFLLTQDALRLLSLFSKDSYGTLHYADGKRGIEMLGYMGTLLELGSGAGGMV